MKAIVLESFFFFLFQKFSLIHLFLLSPGKGERKVTKNLFLTCNIQAILESLGSTGQTATQFSYQYLQPLFPKICAGVWILGKCNGRISASNFMRELYFRLKDYISDIKNIISNNSSRSLRSLEVSFISKILQYDYIVLIISNLQIITIKLPKNHMCCFHQRKQFLLISKYICCSSMLQINNVPVGKRDTKKCKAISALKMLTV